MAAEQRHGETSPLAREPSDGRRMENRRLGRGAKPESRRVPERGVSVDRQRRISVAKRLGSPSNGRVAGALRRSGARQERQPNASAAL